VLAHPLKTRLIADAQIKTDKIDAAALATLLRGNLVARAHVPGKATRLRKDQLRQRLYWSRLRTRIRNRLHALLDRQDDPCLHPSPSTQLRLTRLCNSASLPNQRRMPEIGNSSAPGRQPSGWAFLSDHSTNMFSKVFFPATS